MTIEEGQAVRRYITAVGVYYAAEQRHVKTFPGRNSPEAEELRASSKALHDLLPEEAS